MGGGMAQVVAQGYSVYLQDINPESLERTIAQVVVDGETGWQRQDQRYC
jgi:3-hydroxyacyl-CoA dehydrogenase